MTIEVQVLGLCRWSYPSKPGAFKRDAPGGLEEIRENLYRPVRMEQRLLYLEHVVLPSLRVQTDVDFKIVMLLGETLPEPYRSRLLALIADIPQIKPVFAPEGQPHQVICREVMQAERKPDVRAVAEFRLDDDDAVGVDFVERVRDFFYKSKGIYRNGGKLVLDFNRGYLLITDDDGIHIEPVITRFWTPGMVMYVRPQAKESLLDFNHAQLWRRLPTLSFPRVPMFLRGAHGGNDSSVSHNPHNMDLSEVDRRDLPKQIKERFNVDVVQLRRKWLALKEWEESES